MKKALCFALLVLIFLASGACAAEVPDLIGNWTVSWSGYGAGIGYANSTENESLVFAIAEQKGRVFSGNLTYRSENGTESCEGFAGAIGLDNKSLYVAEGNEGYALGSIVSRDELELIYLSDGKTMTVAIDKLYRAKA
jgi:hypothetical protein